MWSILRILLCYYYYVLMQSMGYNMKDIVNQFSGNNLEYKDGKVTLFIRRLNCSGKA